VDNDGRHGSEEASGEVYLSAGRHPIDLGYFMRGGSRDLAVRWSGPGLSKAEIPNSRLYRTDRSGSLPVEMASFNGVQVEDGHVQLSWQTASETNSAGFAVQRRATTAGPDSTSWNEIRFVDSKAPGGTTNESRRYQFVDEDPPYTADTLRYRLQQVDLDGTTTFTAPVTVVRRPDQLTLDGPFPNPARARTTIRYEIPQPRRVRLEVFDVTGRRVRTVLDEQKRVGRHERSVDVSSLASGAYFYRLSAGETTKTRKFIVVH
jgi:hypothetical protein